MMFELTTIFQKKMQEKVEILKCKNNRENQRYVDYWKNIITKGEEKICPWIPENELSLTPDEIKQIENTTKKYEGWTTFDVLRRAAACFIREIREAQEVPESEYSLDALRFVANGLTQSFLEQMYYKEDIDGALQKFEILKEIQETERQNVLSNNYGGGDGSGRIQERDFGVRYE